MSFKRVLGAVSCGLALSAVAITTTAQQASEVPVALRPSDIAWQPGPPALPAGAEVAVLTGNPAEPAPFTVRVRLPANYHMGAHRHSVAEYVTLLSGTLCIATGERPERAQAACLDPGSFFVTPANAVHAVWSQGPVEYQLHAAGPFDMTYVNPADDPRTPEGRDGRGQRR